MRARRIRKCSNVWLKSGIKTPARAELIAFDRKRQGRKSSNKGWQSTSDEEARIAKLKDGRTHMAYKPEHVADLESGAVVSAGIHPADQGDTTTLDDAQAKLCDQGEGGSIRH